MKVQGIKIKRNPSSFSLEAAANFSSGSIAGCPHRLCGGTSLCPVWWLLASSGWRPGYHCFAALYTRRSSCPCGKALFGGALLVNKHPWTLFGAGMKGTSFCFNITASCVCSEKHPCNLQAGEKNLSSYFQPSCCRWTEWGRAAAHPQWSHSSSQHWDTATMEMLMGQGR